jgi:hypothetical protein
MNAVTRVSAAEAKDPIGNQFLVVIGELGDDLSHKLVLQDFFSGNENFLPVFSSVAHFFAETAGSGHERRGLIIAKDLLAELLRGDELLIVNPGSENPQRLTKADLL